MTGKFDELHKSWVGDLNKLSAKWCEDFQGIVGGYADSVMGDAFDPQKFTEFLRSSGVDFTGLLGALRGQGQPAADPYWILGLDRSASDEEVKARHRELARKLHPDASGTEGTNRFFQMVQTAYEAIERERGW
ncbi:MAG: J domain-containing protein [Dehalococcoidales bacterium]|nr:J domain-containing protein [Dehalococcoidales bacterium]